MSCIVFVNKRIHSLKGVVEVPISKSVANRFLVLDFLCGFERYKQVDPNWSKDIQAIWHALQAIKKGARIINIEESGTALRFIAGVLSLQVDKTFILTGTGRIPERPMQPLVDAIRKMGGQLNYVEREGFAPLQITGKALHSTHLQLDGSASSQFASSLLLIAPFIEGGIKLSISENSKSLSYLTLTLSTLSEYGGHFVFNNNEIVIPKQRLTPSTKKWPCDWSSVPYFLALAACVDEAEIFIKDAQKDPSQADFVSLELFNKYFGIESTFHADGLNILKSQNRVILDKIELSGKDCPDLIPTIICCAAFLKRPLEIRDIEHLRHKESDRLAVLTKELDKVAYHLEETSDHIWVGSSLNDQSWPTQVAFDPESDHRMAMSLGLFALGGISVHLTDASCVKKSFPRYWEMLSILGIQYEIT